MTVGELLDKMSADELTEWAAFYQLEASERTHADKIAQMRQTRRR